MRDVMRSIRVLYLAIQQISRMLGACLRLLAYTSEERDVSVEPRILYREVTTFIHNHITTNLNMSAQRSVECSLLYLLVVSPISLLPGVITITASITPRAQHIPSRSSSWSLWQPFH